MVLHEELLYIPEAVREGALRRDVQDVEGVLGRNDLSAKLHIVFLAFHGSLLVLLDDADAAAILHLEPLGVLVAVEDLALDSLVDLLLQHAEVAVSDGLLQLGVLLWVVRDGRLPELLHHLQVADLLDDTWMLYGVNGGLAQLLQEETVAQTVAFVEEQIKLLRLNQVKAEVLQRLSICIRHPNVEFVEHRYRLNLHERRRKCLVLVNLREVLLTKGLPGILRG